MSLAHLPTELYIAILSHIPPSALQQTVLALNRALPLSPIPLQYLFQSIRLMHPEQAPLLHRRLRLHGPHSPTPSWIREFSLETWSADADVVINLLRLVPRLESLSLWVGPNNFAPEHLEELFCKPIVGLKYLAIRFRPYVQKATYFQFLKGAYFDSTLLALSKWPPGSLPTVSIVQDPLDPGVSSRQAFAQPIVFFRLDPYLSILLHSPSISFSLTSLRLRIPSRPVARSLCIASPSSVEAALDGTCTPALEYLDLSTCGVLEGEMDMILVRFKELKHLVLDGCAVLRGELREREWAAMGKRCALVGVRRAKEREKNLKAWLESRTVAGAVGVGSDGAPAQAVRERPQRVRPGRRGLATATISLREREEHVASSSATTSPALSAGDMYSPGRIPKIRILPPLPTLLSLSTTASSLIKPEMYDMIRAEFEAGWAEGIAQLAVTRARMRTSAGNGVRVVRFADDGDGVEDGLDGLDDVDRGDGEAFACGSIPAPVLCLVGAGRGEEHAEGCGHSVGWDIWKDDL